MKRYFLLIIVVTLVGVTTQKKNGQEANFRSTPLKERRVIAAITTCENSTDYTDTLTPYTKLNTSAGVVNEEKIYGATAHKNSVHKIIISLRRQVNKTIPHILYNILRSMPYR